MTDPLVVAQSYFKRYSSLGGALFGRPRTPALEIFDRSSETDVEPYSLGLSAIGSRVGEINGRLDKLADAAKSIHASLGAADAVLSSLAEAKSLAGKLDPGKSSALEPATATGTPLVTGPVDLVGTVALSDDVAASGSGDLMLSPVGATGTLALRPDAVASVAGTRDVAGIESFVAQTAIGASETLTIDTGNGIETIAFGNLEGQADSADELKAAIDRIDGVSARFTAEGSLVITADEARSDITIGGTADVELAFGIEERSYASVNLASQGIGEGETLTFQVNGDAARTVTFGTGEGQVATLAELQTELAGISGLTASVDEDNRLVFSANTIDDVVTVGGSVDTAEIFGVEKTDYDPGDLMLQGISEGETLTFQISGGAVQIITFGTGAGEVSTIQELNAALAGLSGITASVDGSNKLKFSVKDGQNGVTVGGTANLAGVLGLVSQTYGSFNLLDQGVDEGQTLTFRVGDGTEQTITFGSGSGLVSTLDEFKSALESVSGLSASLDERNRLTIAGSGEDDEIAIGGTADVEAAFGVAEQVHRPTDLLTLGAGQGETLTFYVTGGPVDTVTFGTGIEEVSTLTELDFALSGLSGLSASVDDQNRLTFTAGNTRDSITIGGTADIEGVFGISEGTYRRTGGNGAVVEDINDAFEEIADSVAAVGDDGLGNPIGGIEREIVLSERSGDSITVGGFDLGLDGLGINPVGDDTYASASAVNQAVASIDDAIGVASSAISGLTDQFDGLFAGIDFQMGLSSALTDGRKATAVIGFDDEEALQAARDTRDMIGQADLGQGLSGGFAGNLGNFGEEDITFPMVPSRTFSTDITARLYLPFVYGI